MAVVAETEAPSVRAAFGIDRMTVFHWAVLLGVAAAVLLPLVFLVLGSFSANEMPTDFSFNALTLDHYKRVWLDPDTYTVFYNTFVYVFGATAFGIAMAALLAWLVERTNMPGKVWIYAGVPLTLAMPGMLQAMAYVLLFSPRIGFVNKAIEPLGLGPINIYSLGGMIFIEGLRLVPTAFLMLVPLLRSMDPSLEEAAAMSGASPRSTMRRVTMKLMLPGLLAVSIYQCMTALEVFEIPGILGLPASIYVFSTKIYTVLHSISELPAYGDANALAMIYVFIAIAATWLYARVIVRSERFTIITGKGYRPREIDLGVWRIPAVLAVVLFLLFSVILPFLVLLYVSFLPYIQAPSMAAFRSMSFHHYVEIWRSPHIGQVMLNTIYLILITSTLTVLVSFMISLVIVRSKFAGRKVLDQLAFLPHAIPGIVMGLAFLWLFLQTGKIGFDIHGGVLAMSIAFVVGFLAYGTRSMNAAILQVHKDLEEAAFMSGAGRVRTTFRVFFPLLMPTFVGVWIWAMLLAVRNAGKPLILHEGAENQVLSILIWSMWDSGEIETVGAIGTLLIVALLIITLLLRKLGFGRSATIQQVGR